MVLAADCFRTAHQTDSGQRTRQDQTAHQTGDSPQLSQLSDSAPDRTRQDQTAQTAQTAIVDQTAQTALVDQTAPCAISPIP
jgi:hypothetical protein